MLTYKGYTIITEGVFPKGFAARRKGVESKWFQTLELLKAWADENAFPVILDPEAMSPFMACFWASKANTLKGKADYLDPWRKPMSELRKRLPKGSRVYRAALVGLHGKSEIVTL